MFNGENYVKTIRASAVSSTTYVQGNALKTQFANQVALAVSVTIGSATAIFVKPVFCYDQSATSGSVWFDFAAVYNSSVTVVSNEMQLPAYSTAYTFTANGNYTIPVPCKAQWVSAQVKNTGSTTSTLVAIIGQVGVV